MLKTFVRFALFVPFLLMTACSVVAPPYSPALDNIQALKTASSQKIRVGAFTSQPGEKNLYPVPIRANALRSPVGDSFGAYLAAAMTKELEMAGKFSPQCDMEITATLLENNIDVGIASGDATLSAHFVVTRDGVIRYDQVKTTHM
jgi:hypothetical protein